MKPQNIFIISFGYGGHVPSYHDLFIRAYLHQGYKVYSLCGWNSNVRDHFADSDFVDQLVAPDFDELKTEIAVRSQFRFLNRMPFGDRLLKSLRRNEVLRSIRGRSRWKATIEAISKLEREHSLSDYHTVITYIDEFLGNWLKPKHVNRWMSRPWSCLYIWPDRTLWDSGEKKAMIRERLFRADSCSAVGLLGHEAMHDMNQYDPDIKAVLFPDSTVEDLPEQESEIVQEIKHLARGRKIIGLVGQITTRKGVHSMMRLQQMADSNKLFFIIVGECELLQFESEEREWLANVESHKVYRSLQRLDSDSVFNQVCGSCDVLWAVYPNFAGSSNILAKSAIFKRPVLVSKGFLMEEIVLKWNLGRSVNPDDVDSILAGLKEVLEADSSVFNFAGYSRVISHEAFSDAAAELIP